MVLTITIEEDDYPEIFKLYKKDRDKKIKDIFNTGYNIHFPNVNANNKQLEYYTILNSIEEIKSSSGFGSDSRLDDLLQLIQKLTGISNNSSKKGEVGENMLEDIFKKRYGDILFENKAKTPHSGDAWLHLPDKKIIMLESKNYTSRINKDEVEKMEFDMKTNHIRFGVFVSWNSVVQNRKDLDIHTFNHNGETYMITIISNLGDDIIKLDLAVQIIRKLAEYLNESKHFPWVVNDINENLNEFDCIIQKNYKLRDNYYLLSNSIRSSLDLFYNHLRDYQYEINNSAQSIIDKVKSTMNKTVSKTIEYHVPYVDMLSKFKDDPKILPILSTLFDVFQTIEDINLELDETTNSIINIIKNKENFGFIKVQRKKVLVSITKINITIEFDSSNYSDNIKIIPDICKNI
jgi:hypothetical protein